jgi:hypothetical protein
MFLLLYLLANVLLLTDPIQLDPQQLIDPALLFFPVLGREELGKVGEDELAVGPGMVVLLVGEEGVGDESELGEDEGRGERGRGDVGEEEETVMPVARGKATRGGSSSVFRRRRVRWTSLEEKRKEIHQTWYDFMLSFARSVISWSSSVNDLPSLRRVWKRYCLQVDEESTD